MTATVLPSGETRGAFIWKLGAANSRSRATGSAMDTCSCAVWSTVASGR